MDYVKYEERSTTLEMFGTVARFTIGTTRVLNVDMEFTESIDAINDASGMVLLRIGRCDPFYVGQGIAVPFLNAWTESRK